MNNSLEALKLNVINLCQLHWNTILEINNILSFIDSMHYGYTYVLLFILQTTSISKIQLN